MAQGQNYCTRLFGESGGNRAGMMVNIDKFLSSNFGLVGLMVHHISKYVNDLNISCVAGLAFLDSLSRSGKDV